MKKVVLLGLAIINIMADCMLPQSNLKSETRVEADLEKNESSIIQDVCIVKKMMYMYGDSELTLNSIPHGVANEVFYIQRSNDILGILKKYRNKDLNLVNDICDFTNKLRLWGIPTPFVFQVCQNGDTTYSLQEYKVGKSKFFSEAERIAVAKLMAQIHQLPIYCNFNSDLLDIPEFHKLFQKTSDRPYFQVIREIFDKTDISYLTSLQVGAIHGDFSYSNLLFVKKNISCILDFDNVRSSYLLTDIARCQIFFGEDKYRNISIDKVGSFVRDYHSCRKMVREELLNFFRHMKLMLVYATLYSYYHVNILKDRPQYKFTCSPFNGDNTDVLFSKLNSIKNLSFIDISRDHIWSKLNFYRNPPILFLGASGIGKTTLMRATALRFGSKYYTPKLTTTRPVRVDDTPEFFEYTSEEKYSESVDIIFNSPANNARYGYRVYSFSEQEKISLMNCSEHGLMNNIDFPAIRILIEGNAELGLDLRGERIDSERRKANRKLQEEIFKSPDFIKQIDLVFENQFNGIDEVAHRLEEKINFLIEAWRKKLYDAP